MLCAKCNYDSPADALFCMKCGAKVENLCSSCNTVNPAEAKFCRKCGGALVAGAPVSSPSPAAAAKTPRVEVTQERQTAEGLEGERKTVTALFADIKGSMELMEDLDPEEARAVIDPALKLMMDAVHRYGGYVAQSTGDGIFALFGAPLAHEDHPQRALYAALKMQEEMRRYSAKLRMAGNPPIEARVGMNTGEVVVRSIATGEGHAEYAPIGHSTGLAARMQALAPSGSIVATQQTQKLCEGYFIFKSLGPTRVKGVSEPINIYEVAGLGPLRTRLQRAAGRGLTKFVGRQSEMEALKRAAELAKQGHGQIAAAMAEAGVGKSRLFYEFKAISRSGWMVLEGFSVSHGKASAYLPLIDLLHGYFEIDLSDDARKRREKVGGKVLMLDRNLEDSLPHLFALLGIVEGDDPLAQMDPHTRRRRLQEAIKRILLRESINQPLMIIFEDLHWIDSETQAMLNVLADSIGTARVLLLVNYRPEYRHEWSNRTHYTQLRLDPLGRESAQEMLVALVGEEPALAPLKRLIIEKTEGNPFFMEETVQVLFEDGALARNGAVKLTRPLGELRIPPTVQAILAARIDRLPPAEKELLQILAVIGKEFPLELVRAVTDRTDDELEPMLSELQLGEFIYEQPTVSGIEYTFKHALTQEVAYNSILAERRRAIHERAGEAIEVPYAERLEDHLSELARHYRLGNNPGKAVRYSQLAAERAANRAAYGEAAETAAAALKLLDRLPEGIDRLRAELDLRMIENSAAVVLHGFASREHQLAVERICEVTEQLGEKKLLLGGLANLANLYFARGEPMRTLELGKRCVDLAADTQEAELLASAHLVAANGAHACGRLGETVSYYRDCALYAEQVTQQATLPFIPSSTGATQLCSVLQLLGRGTEALQLAEKGLSHARESQHLFSLGLALTVVGWLYQYRREPEIARAHAEAAITLAEEHGFPEWKAWGRFHHGWAMTELGHLGEGVSEMEAGITDFRRFGGVPRFPFTRAVLAQAHARLGRHDQALAMLDEALARIESTGERIDEAEMLRLKAEVLLMRDRSAVNEAERCLRVAIDVARAQEAKWWELRTTTDLARLLGSQGRRDEARTMLNAIYGWFTEGFDSADLKDARALLGELNG